MTMLQRSSKKRLPTPIAPDTSIAVTVEVPAVTSDLSQAVGITSEKNPAAVALGRLGGLKGGPARAMKLDKKARSQIAKKAALARWGNKHGERQETQTPTDTTEM